MDKPTLYPLPALVGPIPGEPMRFHVQSRSRSSIKHLVDLEELGFHGNCSCENFNFEHLPKLRQEQREGKPIKYRRCFHIKRAWEYYGALHARLQALDYYKMRHAKAS